LQDSTLPQSRKETKLFINKTSLLFWVIWKPSDTLLFVLVVLTKKQPSPSAKPTNQLGSWISEGIKGVLIIVILGKWSFKELGKPLFIEARILTIFWKPSKVKCSLFSINSNACLKSL